MMIFVSSLSTIEAAGLIAGETYYIQVVGFGGGNIGDFCIEVYDPSFPPHVPLNDNLCNF